MRTDKAKQRLTASASPQQMPGTGGILVIGEVTAWGNRGNALPTSKTIRCVELHELDAALINLLQPATILSPLLCSSFDCLDVAGVLQGIGFLGQYRAMGPGIPNPTLIRSEIKASCPDVDFDIVHLGQAAGLRAN